MGGYEVMRLRNYEGRKLRNEVKKLCILKIFEY